MNEILNQGKNFDIRVHLDLLLNAKKFILVTVSIFLLLGTSYYLLMEDNFETSVVFVTSSNQPQNFGKFGSLAGLNDLNLNNNSNSGSIPTSLYSEILYSTPFQLNLIESEFTLDSSLEFTSFQSYYENIYVPSTLSIIKKYTIGLPQTIWSSIRGANQNHLDLQNPELLPQSVKKVSRVQQQLFIKINNQLEFERNEVNGSIKITFEMPDAMASAQMASQTLRLLREYIENYKTQKSKEELEYLENRFNEKRADYDSIQSLLAEFQDGNILLSTSAAKTKLRNLENEYNLELQVLTELATKVETQKLELARAFPQFQIIEPPIVPLKPVKPSKFLVAFLSVLLGLVISVGFLYLKREILILRKI